MLTQTDRVRFGARHQGPPFGANGGYVAGVLGRRIGAAATVRFDAPVPLDADLTLTRTRDRLQLSDGERVLVTATPGSPAGPAGPPTRDERRRAATPNLDLHPFPDCFVCGHRRDPGDALRIDLAVTDDGVAVGEWTPHASLTDADGAVPSELAWAALDCPGGWAVFRPGEVGLLGTITARVERKALPEWPVTVVARVTAVEGRKRRVATALYDIAGQPLAWAESTWIAIDGGTRP